MRTVYAMDKSKWLDDFPCFITLKVPDEMPAQRRRVEVRNLRQRFLDAILAKIGNTQIIRYLDKFYRFRLRDRNQCDLLRVASRFLCRFGDTRTHGSDIFGELFRAQVDHLIHTMCLSNW